MKFRFHDEDENKDYTVEEIIEENKVDDETEALVLTKEEIQILKNFIPFIGKVKEFLETTDSKAKDEDEEVEEEIKDEDEEEFEEEKIEDDDKEEIVETTYHDSKKSFGSVEKRKELISDSADEDDVSRAWAKRYGGKN